MTVPDIGSVSRLFVNFDLQFAPRRVCHLFFARSCKCRLSCLIRILSQVFPILMAHDPSVWTKDSLLRSEASSPQKLKARGLSFLNRVHGQVPSIASQ